MSYVLIMVLLLGTDPATQRLTSITAEFNNRDACFAAAQAAEMPFSRDASYQISTLTVCTPKGNTAFGDGQ